MEEIGEIEKIKNKDLLLVEDKIEVIVEEEKWRLVNDIGIEGRKEKNVEVKKMWDMIDEINRKKRKLREKMRGIEMKRKENMRKKKGINEEKINEERMEWKVKEGVIIENDIDKEIDKKVIDVENGILVEGNGKRRIDESIKRSKGEDENIIEGKFRKWRERLEMNEGKDNKKILKRNVEVIILDEILRKELNIKKLGWKRDGEINRKKKKKKMKERIEGRLSDRKDKKKIGGKSCDRKK